MKKLMLPLSVLFLLISCHQEKIRLKFELLKEQTFDWDISSSSKYFSDDNDGGSTSVQKIKNRIHLHVLAVQDSTYLLNFNYRKLEAEFSGGAESEYYSSETMQGQDVYTKILKEIKNIEFRILVNKKGKVLNIENGDSIQLALMNKYFGVVNGPNSGTIKMIIDRFDGLHAKDIVESLIMAYPENEVSPGQTWSSERAANLHIIPLIITTIYSFKGYSKDEAKISYSAQLRTPKITNYEGMYVIFTLTGETKAETSIDVSSGLVNSGKIDLHLSGYVNSINESKSLGIPMPMDDRSEITIEKVHPEATQRSPH